MKRTCEGCRAFSNWGNFELQYCTLNFKTTTLIVKYKTLNGHYETKKPLEECPKPKTYKELIECGSKLTGRPTQNKARSRL